MLNRSASLTMSTSVLKALPGKFDIKIHSPSILYILGVLCVCVRVDDLHSSQRYFSLVETLLWLPVLSQYKAEQKSSCPRTQHSVLRAQPG